MLHNASTRLTAALLIMVIGTCAFAADPAQPVPGTGVDAGGLWETGLRTILSLAAVLAVLGACAWAAKRLRDGGHLKSGLIQIVSGVSLGGREKVVLLRVGDDEILVGVSPSGMAPLHVLTRGDKTRQFSEYMDSTE